MDNTGRLVIVTDIIAPYRVPVFNCLSDILGGRLLVLFMGETEAKRQWAVPSKDIRFQYEVLSGRGFRIKNHLDTTHFLNLFAPFNLNRFNPTLIVIGGYHHYTSYIVWLYAKIARKKICLWCENNVNDIRSGSFITELVKKAYIKSCDGYIVPGVASRHYLKNYGIDSDRIITAPNAIDTGLFKKHMPPLRELKYIRSEFRKQWGLSKFNLLFVGRLSPEKGMSIVLNVLSILQHDGMDVGLIIVGDGPLRIEYESRVKKEGIKHTAFVGFQEQHKLPFYYSQGDILIMPSKSEAWGLVVNEAMTCGVPVICSGNVGAAEDMVIEGKTGFVCDSVPGYVSKIETMITDQKTLKDMSSKCIAMANKYTPENCANGFIKALGQFG